MLPFFLTALLVATQASAISRQEASDTAVGKVLKLLNRLSVQIAEEGKTEAAEYDKFACFCKEQADEKQYQIEKSDKKIKQLTAQIEELDAVIADLNTDIQALGERITEIEGLIDEAKTTRTEEHDKYVVEEKDISDAIAATRGAIKALQDSKKKLKDAKLDFVELQSIMSPVLARIADASASSSSKKLRVDLSALVKSLAPGKPARSEYQSNDIIVVLQELLVTFKDNKKELDTAEFELKVTFDKKVLNLGNEKKFKEAEKSQKEQTVEEKTEELHKAQDDKDSETKAWEADKAFRTELESECSSKAETWDQRSEARSGELTAIAKAIEHLKSGVQPNYGANKKLVGLQKKSIVVPKGHWAWVADTKKAASFLQVSSAGGAAAVVERALGVIAHAGSKLHSSVLTGLSMKLTLGADHFAKVRSLINDLITKLEEEAAAEADTKSMCDTDMKKAVSDRDQGNLDIEEHSTTIHEEETNIRELTKEIAGLSKDISELNKALSEATELRNNEKAENEKTLSDAADGKEAVESAMEVLSSFYDNAFIQKEPVEAFKAAGSDRDGNTLGDLAPKTSFDGDYKGKQDASKGIMGILEVILADFERTLDKVKTDEDDAASDHTTFETDTEADIDAKEKEKSGKKDDVTTAEEDIVTAKDNLKTATGLRDLSLEELEKLNAMCVEGTETWEERSKQREEEVAALREALKILQEWKE